MIISKINHIIIDGKNGIEAWNPYGFLDFFFFRKTFFIKISIPKYNNPTKELKIINKQTKLHQSNIQLGFRKNTNQAPKIGAIITSHSQNHSASLLYFCFT